MKPLIILFLLLTLVSPNFVLAQAGGSSSAPPPGTSGSKDTFVAPDVSSGYIAPGLGFVPCSGEGCSACHFVILANTIIKWLITISFLLFAVLAVMAGFKLVTSGGNPSARSAAKSSFTNAFIGLIIIMAAWLAVDTLLRGLLGKDGVLSDGQVSGYGPWSQVQCASQYSASNNTVFGEFSTEIEAVSGSPEAAKSGGGPGVTPSGNLVTYAGAKFDSAVVDKIKYIAENFNLSVSGGHRTPERNAAVGGVATSYHLTGRAGDFTGTLADMKKAEDWARKNGAKEILIHNVKTGNHLHVAW